MNNIPTILIGLRLLLVAPLWAFALLDMQRALALGLALALITDVLDGQAGRWLGQNSELTSRLDSLADKVLAVSVLAWLLLLHPAVVREHPVLSLGALLLALLSWLAGLARHGRVAGLHLVSAKVAGAAQAAFVLHTFWAGAYSQPLFYLAAGLWWLAAVEEIAVQLTHAHVGGGTRSLLRAARAPSDPSHD